MTRATSTDRTNRARRRLVIVVAAIAVVFAMVAAWFVFGGERAAESSEDAARQRLSGSNVPTGTDRSTPAPGLYRYEGRGTEESSLPPMTEQQGPKMPATVVVQPDGCWVLQIDLNTQHWQNWTYCRDQGSLTEKQSTVFTRRKIGTLDIENTSSFPCEPAVVLLAAADGPGTERRRSCTGRGTYVPDETRINGLMTIVGEETVMVGGQAVPTQHVRHELTLSGAQTGTETTDLWFATDGMLVRRQYKIAVDTESPIGPVHYDEDSEITLQAMAPA